MLKPTQIIQETSPPLPRSNNSSDVLADTLTKWLELYKSNTHPKSDEMPWLTWEESTSQLLECMGISKK